ncbi:RHS repeat domain-containing protein [Bacteroides uniformis]|uniref:RHS repeat domain-containing protein n=1 Tax=Bacteroides uniformis TaxID=820 RepID=UPI0039798972
MHEQDGFFRSGGACAELGGTGFPTSQFTNDTSGYSKGSLTGSAVTVSGSSTKIYKGYYYDVKGRVTKVVQNNLLGGYDVTNTVYTFTGQPATVTHSHTASGKSTRTEVYTYSYDHADRVSKVEHTLGGTKITLADYTYDSFGRLSTKSLHGSAANKLTYAYNLRCWLTGITSTRFTQNLYYNTGVGTARYNGNISSMTWKSGNESTVRGYKFTYDGLDRMLNATYGETAGISTNANRFSENVTGYDKNGNIKGLQRYGQLSSTAYGMIDNLTLTLNGNQLNRVDDAVAASTYNGGFEFKNGANAADEYSYDANGNLTKDLNKGISGITYNFLNLPNAVTFSDGSTITYTYGADGTKLRTVHKIGSTTTTTDYCGNVIYENGVQKLLLTEEGYITLSDSKYHYYLKDHQGNNRVVISQSGTVEETSHYYPFGGVFASAGNVQPYKYNGKELDTKKGLNWYDYGARHYDAVLGRFITVDALYDKHFKVSPYVYCGNEPVGRIDPDGNDWRVQTHYNRETDKIEYKITVRAALINNSNNKELDIKTLAGQIVEQVNAAYTISGDDFVSTMDMQLRTVNSVDDIKDTEHVLQIVDQDMLTKTDKSVVMAETYKNSLDVKIGTKAVSNMLNNDDNRTFAHELGHSGGLGHTMNVENLMTQKKVIQDFDGDYLKATQLNRSQIQTVRDNYIHNKLNRHIPNWRQKLKRRQ